MQSPLSERNIIIQGARQHNLKNVDVVLPHNKLIVVTGPSGSGKSSLAFDTLYAEGQRRYVESLSSYARQFLDQMQKPDVEHMAGLSPAIAIEQRSAGGNPRSIVATTTEIYDYLRLLYAHIGVPHCPGCGDAVSAQSPQRICDHLDALPQGRRMMLLAPYVRGKKGTHKDVFEAIRRDGYARMRVNGDLVMSEDEPDLDKNKKHDIEAVVDRLVAGKTDRGRLSDSVERTLRSGDGMLVLMLECKDASGWDEELISEHFACTKCSISFGELQPRSFSFNSPYGACKKCHGLGTSLAVDERLAVDGKKTLAQGPFPVWKVGMRRMVRRYQNILNCAAAHHKIPLDVPYEELSAKHQAILLEGHPSRVSFAFRWAGRQLRYTEPFDGFVADTLRRYHETESKLMRDRLRKILVRMPCSTCHGARLRPESLAVTVNDIPIHQFLALSVSDAHETITTLNLEGERLVIAGEIVREIAARVGFLCAVGLGYLTLNRESGTLSGGEAQRIRLATQIGSGLVGVMYVLDEPSIGLHQRDNRRLLDTLIRLRDLGNTVVVVEHDTETIETADYIVDMGPGAGSLGGEVVYAGPPQECHDSLTGLYLRGVKKIAVPEERQVGNGNALTVSGATANNLHNLTAKIPLGLFCCVTGVSGSGKSTLVNQVLVRALKENLAGRALPSVLKRLRGMEHVDKMIVVDQSPIGRTPRSNPITYTGGFDHVRQLFAKLADSKIRGYKPGRFSFNVKGGRCDECKGDGIRKIEMNFLPDVYVPCETCKGKRYNQETLQVRYKGRNIAEVLDMTVHDACEFFSAVPMIHRILFTLDEVGLGYIRLGQSATTLSGGEAQRVKLSTELAKKPRGHTLYVLDEPTTGLHIDDVQRLLEVVYRLRDRGNTILVIEHNLDVIKACDHIIDMGPEGGDGGGEVVAQGTPEQVCKVAGSYTGQFLKDILDADHD